jgi:hypothetical protein
MADYFTQTVIQPTIPIADITPLERLILSNTFSTETHGEELYFFAEDNPALVVGLDRDELSAALAASKTFASSANAHVVEQLADLPIDEDPVDLDLSDTSWEFLFQDIVRRSKTLRYVTAVSSFTCSKMRADGFGGMAVLITADSVMGKSTSDFIEDFLAEAGLDEAGEPAPAPAADGTRAELLSGLKKTLGRFVSAVG